MLKDGTKFCDVCGISEKEKTIKYSANTNMHLCAKHYKQMYSYGRITDPSSRTTHDRNEIRVHENYAELIIRDSKNNIAGTALIDLQDVDKIKEYKWGIVNNEEDHVYISTKINKKNVRLHRLILGYYGSNEIDHINRNTFDNRKENLRIVDRAVNAQNNKSKGISITKNGKYRASFQRYGKTFHVGTFKTAEAATEARKQKIAEIELHINEIKEEYENKKENCPKGVIPTPSGKYKAYYFANNKKHNIGTYETKEQAYIARVNAIAMHKTA